MLLIPVVVLVPYGIPRVLAISESDNGIASLLLPYVVPPALIADSACWLLESLDASGAYEHPEYLDLRRVRTILATLGGTAPWALIPVAPHVPSERLPAGASHKTEVRVLGFAKAYGAPFTVQWALILAPAWLAAQPSSQITLALATGALLAHLEIIDAARDTRALQASFSIIEAAPSHNYNRACRQQKLDNGRGQRVTMDEVVPLALLAQLAFFASGHQATLVSLQRKAALVLTSKVAYPLSPLIVILNTFGPTAAHRARRAAHRNLERHPARGNARHFLVRTRTRTTASVRTRVVAADEPRARCGPRCGTGGSGDFAVFRSAATRQLAQSGMAAPPSHGLEGVRTTVYAWCR